MLKRLRAKFISIYYKALHSIGFYPTIIALCYFAFALLLLSLNIDWLSILLADWFPWLLFKDIETPRAILTTLLAGMISLTVLSFSMVMVVLGQAVSNYSPKILLGLVSEKAHQIVLGHYLGSIIYFLVLLAAFRASENYLLPSLGVFISIGIGIWCLILFVYFIHNTSQSIQINLIIKQIYEKTKRALGSENDQPANAVSFEGKMETLIHANQTGYIQNWNSSGLASIAEKEGWFIQLLFQQGDYLLDRYPIIRVLSTETLPDEQQQKNILSQLTFYEGEPISEHYHYGFTQLMEIAVKALSPAINDPGTARICVHYLTDLLRIKMETAEENVVYGKEQQALISWRPHAFEAMLYKSFTPILQYGKHDISICLGLIQAIKTLAWFDQAERYKELIQQYFDNILDAIRERHLSAADRTFMLPRLETGNTYLHSDL